jgi:hypothetical protein
VPRDTTVRQRVVDYLIEHGPVEDASGRATSQLKEAVGYGGGDAGFIRIVSLMAEAGEVVREVRGKRTYRIAVSAEAAATTNRAPSRPASASSAPSAVQRPTSVAGGELDYDELAAALLARVARTLVSAQADEERGAVDQAAWARRRIDQLEGKVSALQRDLARARAEVQSVVDEREALRSQLEAATHNVDVLTERLGTRPQVPERAAERLDSDAQALLYRLRGSGSRRGTESAQAEAASSP